MACGSASANSTGTHTMIRVRQPVIECIFDCLLHFEWLVKCKMYPKSTPNTPRFRELLLSRFHGTTWAPWTAGCGSKFLGRVPGLDRFTENTSDPCSSFSTSLKPYGVGFLQGSSFSIANSRKVIAAIRPSLPICLRSPRRNLS